MKKKIDKVHKFDSLSELNKSLGLPKPLHPMICLNNYADITTPFEELPKATLLSFYKISHKFNLTGKIGYGQHNYDFAEGRLAFIKPNQVLLTGEADGDLSGCTLLFHPDFILNYPLAAKIKNYDFFSYAANEALFLSDKEKQTIFRVFDDIREELNNSIDDTTQDVLVSHIEVLLNYSNRYYKRQFITRKVINSQLLTRLEQLLHSYFENKVTLLQGLPTVEYLAGKLNVSPRYLSDMLRSVTGQNAQQHIQSVIIEKAKEYLADDELSVGEIAVNLGFAQSQSFSKLFKRKTSLTPIEFRQSLN